MHRSHRTRTTPTRGFTIIEILVATAIIIVLVGILGVTLSKARNAAQRGLTERQVASIVQALDSFRNDFGYYPPLLADLSDYTGGPGDIGALAQPTVPKAVFRSDADQYAEAMEGIRYHSIYTLPAYLVGVGDLNRDQVEIYDESATEAVEPNYDDGADGPGIRNPGPDKSWGGAANREAQQAPEDVPSNVIPARPPTGPVYGPYLDIGAFEGMLRREPETIMVGGGEVDNPMAGLYTLRDPFDNPIRYYKDWPRKDDSGDTTITSAPVELRSPGSVEAQLGGELDEALERDAELLKWDMLVLSAGDRPRFEDIDGNPIAPFGDTQVIGGMWQPIPAGPENPFTAATYQTLDDRTNLIKDLSSNVRGGR